MKILFTDIDGTLLDHNTYSYQESLEGISMLKEANIPLVLVSSKTFPEIKELHTLLKLTSPYIFENGGGIAHKHGNSPEYKVEIPGLEITELRQKADILNDVIDVPVKTIMDMELNEIVDITGLTIERAELAMKREASLPFILMKEKHIGIDELEDINKKLNPLGLTVTKGGRFFHFSDVNSNKGSAVKRVVKIYREINGLDSIKTVGVGDSENDIPMLRAVDEPFLVRKQDRSTIRTGLDNVNVTNGIGPAGFTEAVKRII